MLPGQQVPAAVTRTGDTADFVTSRRTADFVSKYYKNKDQIRGL